MKYVVVGGVAGGATAAARLRRADEFAEIVLFEKGKYISYANCGLPYYVGGVIEDREHLFLQTPQSFKDRFNIDVRVASEVTSIDPESKTVAVRRQDGVVYTETYDKLLLSPGARPVSPPLEGIDIEGIFTLRDVGDTDRIKDCLTNKNIKKAVVVGAGFIGLEMAENLLHAGADVSIVEMGNQVMAPLDFSMAALVHRHLTDKGVNLYLEQSVERFVGRGEEIMVHLNSGEVIVADMVILSVGVRPETKLAETAGIKIGETGGIRVDEYLQTSVKDIYAVGDAIEFPHPLTGKPWLNYLANPANRQGRIVADNMVSGNVTAYEGAIGTSIAKVFDMTVAATGLAGKRLKQWNIPYRASWTHSYSHASYYPEALSLSIKLLFDPNSGKLYGAQCVGYGGVDKRIDQIALLIKNGGTIYDLIQIEHAYAPPYSSAKDPLSIAGYVAANILNGLMPIVSWREMAAADSREVVILDVRTREEFSVGAIAGAVNIPVDDLRERINEIPVGKPVYVYCAIGLRGYIAGKILRARGIKVVKNLSGGYKTYSAAVAPLVKSKAGVTRNATNGNSGKVALAAEIGVLKVNACGLQCPGPILKVKEAIDSMAVGERVEIVSTDAAFARDVEAWCKTTGNSLIENSTEKGKYTVLIEKGKGSGSGADDCSAQKRRGKTFIMFSDDLDKALATFVLANGAAATGEKITIFFTFWGLNVIKKTKKPKVHKDIFGKMFGMMMPSGSKKLKLSQMNMWGMGSAMMRYVMKRKGIDSLESLRDQAIAQGVEFIACQMSMDVMGVKKEELLDEATIGGVATYMGRADEANVNLFI